MEQDSGRLGAKLRFGDAMVSSYTTTKHSHMLQQADIKGMGLTPTLSLTLHSLATGHRSKTPETEGDDTHAHAYSEHSVTGILICIARIVWGT